LSDNHSNSLQVAIRVARHTTRSALLPEDVLHLSFTGVFREPDDAII
jgi:hypothetical protein